MKTEQVLILPHLEQRIEFFSQFEILNSLNFCTVSQAPTAQAYISKNLVASENTYMELAKKPNTIKEKILARQENKQ